MFTGIVEDTGKITDIRHNDKEILFTLKTSKIDASQICEGESISVNGVCLTVKSAGNGVFCVEASQETLTRTTLSCLKNGSAVNLERALLAGGRLGGHFVTGHIDGTGRVDSRKNAGKSVEFWFRISHELSKYMIVKGSVAIDGVSLTVNKVIDNSFSVNIIPYTLEETTFCNLSPGDSVNIECDIIGKYVERLLNSEKDDKRFKGLLNKLRG